MKTFIKMALVGLLFFTHSMYPQDSYKGASLLAASALVFGTVKAYRYVRTPQQVNTDLTNLKILTFNPTNDMPASQHTKTMHEVCIAAERGQWYSNDGASVCIKDKNYTLSTVLPSGVTGPLTVYGYGYDGRCGTRRYNNGAAAPHGASKYRSNGLIGDGPIVSFAARLNEQRTFNFGQELDQQCLGTVLRETIARNPNAQLRIAASCKGGTTVLNYLANPDNKEIAAQVQAVVLESPSSSLDALANNVAKNYLPQPLQPLLPKLFCFAFPNYKKDQPTILDNAADFPSHIHTLIGCLPNDKVASPEDTQAIAHRLQKHQKSVTLFTCDKPRLKHGHLSEDPAFQQAVSELYHESSG